MSVESAILCRLFENRLTEDRVLKTLKGSVIKRSKYGVGKDIGGQIYVHKMYATFVLGRELYEEAVHLLRIHYPDFKFNCVTYNKKSNTVRFDEAPDFDTAREPIPGNMITLDLESKEFTKSYSNQIWHHKWLWVKDDYREFDVVESFQWSKTWLQYISNPSGNKIKWEQNLKSVGLI